MTKEELQAKVYEIFSATEGYFDSPHLTVEVSRHGSQIHVTVSRMYEHVNLTFKILLALSEVFGTKEFDTNNWSSSGCETCDYGRSYTHEFSYEEPE